MARQITTRQTDVLDFYRYFQAQHGRVPSFREVMAWFDFASLQAVTSHVQRLVDRGEMLKSGHGHYVPKSREISCDCPHCGGAVTIVEEYTA